MTIDTVETHAKMLSGKRDLTSALSLDTIIARGGDARKGELASSRAASKEALTEFKSTKALFMSRAGRQKSLSPWAYLPAMKQSNTLLSLGARSRRIGTYCSKPSYPSSCPSISSPSSLSFVRAFTSTSPTRNWLLPKSGETKKTRKGRPRVPTGGSTRGTTVVWGEYGLRMREHHRRVSAAQLKNGEEAIRKRLRGLNYRMFMRVSANIGVYTSGNESRMGKGKGSFDYWASRVAVSKVLFELKGEFHEQIAREAFRLAANKMPGQYEFVKKGDPPVMGITKLEGVTVEELKRPRRKLPLEVNASRIPSTT
ncbi:MAG: mitochondrial ribosomal large subunit component [Sclerophora amabilis]|nr:MAG: mitochondrial ribosomal large subunit component [Sclerophora amabilis]